MKRILFSLVPLLVLAACAHSGETVTYNITTNVTDISKQQILVQQSERVIERRLESLGEKKPVTEIKKTGSGFQITAHASNKDMLSALTQQLQQPFKLRVMAETQPGEKADITVEKFGGFSETGISEKDLDWVIGGEEPGTKQGQVELAFTAKGRQKMSALFKVMKGKYIGLFVRDQLVSRLHVDTDKLEAVVVIRQIPQPELAQIFADDVNVGLHVAFTVVPK